MRNSALYRGRGDNGRFISNRVKTTPLVTIEQALQKAIIPKAQKGQKLIAKDSVPNEYMLRQLYRESLFKEDAKSGKDAKGLAQIRDIAVKELKNKFGVEVDPMNAKDAIVGHKTLMFDQYNKPWVTKGNPPENVRLLKATSGYNYGSTATVNALNEAKKAGVDIYKDYDGIKNFLPKETQKYADSILGKDEEFNKNYNKALPGFKYSNHYPTEKKQKGGIITDPKGQWAHPGKNTRIPGSSITMKGVDYPVVAKTNDGRTTLMEPDQEYQFPGAKYVDEFPMKPQMRSGGQFQFGTAFSTGQMPRTFSIHRFGTSYGTPRPKNLRFDSLGDYNRQLAFNKFKTFEHGGTMLGSKPNRRDLLKKGVDATLYPLPFKKGGKMGAGDATSSQSRRANFLKKSTQWKKANGGIIWGTNDHKLISQHMARGGKFANYTMGDKLPPKSYQAGGVINPFEEKQPHFGWDPSGETSTPPPRIDINDENIRFKTRTDHDKHYLKKAIEKARGEKSTEASDVANLMESSYQNKDLNSAIGYAMNRFNFPAYKGKRAPEAAKGLFSGQSAHIR